MRIVSKEEFMQLQPPIIYSRYNLGNIEGLYICYDNTTTSNDFCEISLLTKVVPKFFLDDKFSSEEYEKIISHWSDTKEMELLKESEDDNKEFELDLNCRTREGLYDNNIKYVIYDKVDLLKLINKLQQIYISKYEL